MPPDLTKCLLSPIVRTGASATSWIRLRYCSLDGRLKYRILQSAVGVATSLSRRTSIWRPWTTSPDSASIAGPIGSRSGRQMESGWAPGRLPFSGQVTNFAILWTIAAFTAYSEAGASPAIAAGVPVKIPRQIARTQPGLLFVGSSNVH